jgi:hypothetical protein
VRKNAGNSRIFNALRPFPVPFEPLPQNHCSIPDNPIARFGTFPEVKPQFSGTLKGQPLKEVQPYRQTLAQNRNPLSEHSAFPAHPIQAKISRLSVP